METVIYNAGPTFQEILILLAVSAGIVLLIVALWRAAWMLRVSRREPPLEIAAAEMRRRESAQFALAAIKPRCGNCGTLRRGSAPYCASCGWCHECRKHHLLPAALPPKPCAGEVVYRRGEPVGIAIADSILPVGCSFVAEAGKPTRMVPPQRNAIDLPGFVNQEGWKRFVAHRASDTNPCTVSLP